MRRQKLKPLACWWCFYPLQERFIRPPCRASWPPANATACMRRMTKEQSTRGAALPFSIDVQVTKKLYPANPAEVHKFNLHSASFSERVLGARQSPATLIMHSTGLLGNECQKLLLTLCRHQSSSSLGSRLPDLAHSATASVNKSSQLCFSADFTEAGHQYEGSDHRQRRVQ